MYLCAAEAAWYNRQAEGGGQFDAQNSML